MAPAAGGAALDVVSRLGAIQAQDYAQSLWAVGVRSPGLTALDVEAALRSGEVVRTWPMRGTLHLVPGRDARWMCRLLSAPAMRGAARRHEQLGLGDREFGACRDALVAALEASDSGGALTRAEAFEVIRAAGVAPEGQRGYHVLGRLAQEGLLCQGARLGTEQTFRLLDDACTQRDLGREEAMATVARRYVHGHAPATDRDLAWWSGQNLTWAREALALAGEPDEAPVPAKRLGVQILPGFDEFLLGYADRAHAGSPDALARVVPGNNGMFLPMIVAGGRIVGMWKSKVRAAGLTVIPQWFERPSAAVEAGLGRAARRYARFLGVGLAPPTRQT